MPSLFAGENMLPVVQNIIEAFESKGSGKYGDECVTQTQHALQSAQFAMEQGADAPLIAAALLHDIGHLLVDHDMPGSCHEDLDDDHESKGYQFLVDHFGPTVADPVRLHVVAKRYLCTTNPGYEGKLSPTSLKSFHDQGGYMSSDEKTEFENEIHFQEAIQLRYWDDAAKDPDAVTPTLTEFVPLLESCLNDRSSSA